MNYAALLAGGKGTRMGGDLPKQFRKVCGRPILAHTADRFLRCEAIAHVIVAVPEDWLAYTRALLAREFPGEDRLSVIAGGEDRQTTLKHACAFLKDRFSVQDDDILLTHDAVRPFVTQRVIEENIRAAERFGAVSTAVPSVDTTLQTENGETVAAIPDRSTLYCTQTPQTFQVGRLLALAESLTEEEEKSLTDACKIFVLKGEPVHLVRGEFFNIKITTPYDMAIAEAIAARFSEHEPEGAFNTA